MGTEGERVVVRNPNSGDRKRTVLAREIAEERGYNIRDSAGPGDTFELAREAAEDGSALIVACGGDGTLNDVVRGVMAADGGDRGALDRVTLGVIPAGTGNDFADNVGIRGVRHAFDVIDAGEVRRLDLGVADGRPFINSCVGGLTAEASAKTSPAMKRRLGVVAYVLSTLAEAREFTGLELRVRAGRDDPEQVWSGTALMILIGNGRRFPGERIRQANMEDGLCNVVIIRQAPTLNYLATGAADRLLRRGASHLVRVKVPHLEVTHEGRPVGFSLDGEMVRVDRIEVDSLPGAMGFHVGESYDPAPEEWGRPI